MKMKKDVDLYNLVIKQISKVREQGDPPRSDVTSMDSFVCDLCKDSILKTNLTQCGLCGRWICKNNCWENNNMACISCSGIIKLCKESIELGNIPSGTKKGEDSTKKSSAKNKFEKVLSKVKKQ
jgi:hypothetical protein